MKTIILLLFLLPLPSLTLANEKTPSYTQVNIISALTQTEKIVLTEHSYELDFPTDTAPENPIIYRTVTLNPEQIKLLLQDFQKVDNDIGAPSTNCTFVPHHTLILYHKDQKPFQIPVCYSCIQVKWHDNIINTAPSFLNALKPTLKRVGMSPERDWQKLAKQNIAKIVATEEPPNPLLDSHIGTKITDEDMAVMKKSNREAAVTLQKLFAGIKKPLIHQGLPHPMMDNKKLRIESKRKDTFLLDRYYFYDQSISLSPADTKSLIAHLIKSPASPGPGDKKCGGFHPDYLITWHDEGVKNQLQICFGCGELRFFVDGKYTYWFNTNEAMNRLKPLLKKAQPASPLIEVNQNQKEQLELVEKQKLPNLIVPHSVLRIKTPYNSNHDPKQRDSLYLVSPEGTIDLGKGLGILKVKDLTRQGVFNLLAEKYKGYQYSLTGMNSLEVAILPRVDQLKKKNNAIITGFLKKTFYTIPAENNSFYSAPLHDVRYLEVAIDDKTTLKTAVEAAGGVDGFAAIKRVEFLRDGKKLKINLKTQPDFKILRGDIILVPIKNMFSR